LKTAAVVAPGQSLSYDDYANGGYTDIIFEADDENGVGGMTDIPAGGFTVNGTMKLVKTVKSDKWYSMGFPFDVSAITDASLQTIVPGNGETGDFEMKKYDSENPLFQYTAEVVDAGKGYILKFPAKYNNAEITFCSSPKPTVGNLVLTVTDDFTHIANPGFTNLTFTQGEGDKYYYVLSETKDALDNLFKRSETGVSLTVKPFEAFFAIHWTSTEKVPPMTITSQPDVIDIVGVSGKGDLISTTYYNLRGEVVKNPEEGLLYIVIQTYLSGAQSVSKQFYRK
jgi:hypothetical protein